jgi:plasmid replication initiation protein
MSSTKLSVTKDNALIEAGYRLSLTEMQIILYGISLINPLQKEFPRSFKINIDRFAKLFNREHGQVYHEVKDAVLRRFWERDFSYVDKNSEIVTLRWLTKVVHKDSVGLIEITFSSVLTSITRKLHNLLRRSNLTV